jgi:hypothetical protein
MIPVRSIGRAHRHGARLARFCLSFILDRFPTGDIPRYSGASFREEFERWMV